MAKPLGPKTTLIREAIKTHPNLKNKELASLLSGHEDRKTDGIKVTPLDVAQQKVAMNKPGAAVPAAAAPVLVAVVEQVGAPAEPAAPEPHVNGTAKKRGRPKGSVNAPKKAAAARVTATTPKPAKSASPVELIDRLFELADEAGGMGALKRLVDRLAPMERA